LGTKEHGWAQENHAEFTRACVARGSLLGQLFILNRETSVTNRSSGDLLLKLRGCVNRLKLPTRLSLIARPIEADTH
jgi:hypothetical protein